MSCVNCDTTDYALCLLQGTTEPLSFGPWLDDEGNVERTFTGWNARASARRGFGLSPVLWSRSTTAGNITFQDYTDEDLVVHTDAIISISWDSAVTAAMTDPGRNARWDLEIFDNSTPEIVERLIQGPFCLDREVT